MHRYGAGDWFAIPLRFGLFAVGRAAAVDRRGIILGYFFARFFERLPSGTDMLALSPGDAEIIGVCDEHGLRSGEWPVIATARADDPRPWGIPVFRSYEPVSGTMRWTTVEPADLMRPIVYDREPPEAGVRNWGLAMAALEPPYGAISGFFKTACTASISRICNARSALAPLYSRPFCCALKSESSRGGPSYSVATRVPSSRIGFPASSLRRQQCRAAAKISSAAQVGTTTRVCRPTI
jgi:hypothetical protein